MPEELKKPEEMQEDALTIRMKYGLPDLKKFARRFSTIGLIVAVAAHLLLISSYAFSLYLDNKSKEEEARIIKNQLMNTY